MEKLKTIVQIEFRCKLEFQIELDFKSILTRHRTLLGLNSNELISQT
jgi:hypothetical protein